MRELKPVTRRAWFRFLHTAEGVDGMLWLREQIPQVASGDTSNIILSAGVSQGFRRSLDLIADTIAAEQSSPNEDLENP